MTHAAAVWAAEEAREAWYFVHSRGSEDPGLFIAESCRLQVPNECLTRVRPERLGWVVGGYGTVCQCKAFRLVEGRGWWAERRPGRGGVLTARALGRRRRAAGR